MGYGEFKPLREIAVPQMNPGGKTPEAEEISRQFPAQPGEGPAENARKPRCGHRPESPEKRLFEHL